MDGSTGLPRKKREVANHHIDSRVWNGFQLRSDDVIIATYGKSGTTWAQQIVSQILFGGRENLAVYAISIWLDSRVNPKRNRAILDAQMHRRIIKSHLPFDALPYAPAPKYIYVARDGRDTIWSFYAHLANANEHYFKLYNDTPGRVGPPLPPADPDQRRFFRRWLKEDGAPFWPFWEHVRSWWEARELPNVRLIHFNDLKRDLEGEMRKIASFLACPVPEQRWPELVEHCSFDYMKKNAAIFVPYSGAVFKGGAASFINKGVNGRWRDVLSKQDIRDYERMAREQLGDECAEWLANGWNGRPL